MTASLTSVVIPTRSRRLSVERALQALARQAEDPGCFEVIVAINGEDDGTGNLVERFPAPYRLIAVSQPRPGRAAACNTGIQQANGELVVLLDDDMEPSPAFVSAHVRAHAGRPRLGVMGAVPVATGPTTPPVVAYVARKFARHLRQLADPAYRIGLRDFYSGNFSIRREVLLELGGFDEEFVAYGNEDGELALRLRAAGVTLRYSPEALAHQHYEKTFAELASDSIAQGRTAVLFVRKHPQVMAETKIGSYTNASWMKRLVIRALLMLSIVWRGSPEAVVRVVENAERAKLPFSFRWYSLVLDYCFWLGVHQVSRCAPEHLGAR